MPLNLWLFCKQNIFTYLQKFSSLTFLKALNIYGCVTDEGVEVIQSRFHPIPINRNPFTTIARPTVNESVTSIWGERTRDWY